MTYKQLKKKIKKDRQAKYNTNAKKETVLTLTDEMINKLTKSEMIDLGKKALKMYRQQERRLLAAGYKKSDEQTRFDEGHTIKTKNNKERIETLFSEKMDRKEVYHNLSMMKNLLTNRDNTVEGRVEQQRKTMGFFQQYMNENLAEDTKKKDYFQFKRDRKTGDWKFTQGNTSGTITREQLTDFWKVFDEVKDILTVDMYKYPELVEEAIRIFLEQKDKMSVHELMNHMKNRLDNYYRMKGNR